mmetsp:Transcript_48995/g.104956  ORF Transcript_48995/g.104956 Transcript_48995/m.104956 type:complete len:359 (-) Transcript_48995:42-1118(-)
MRVSILFASAAADAACSSLSDPTACLNGTDCSWLMLQGACHHALSPEALGSPLRCCSSTHEDSSCQHRTDFLPDGSCSLEDSAQSGSFDITYATRMLHLAGAAYCAQDQVEGWSCGTHCSNIAGIESVTYIHNDAQLLAGFVAYDSKQKAAVVAFRGTVSSSVEDWVHNLAYTKTNPLTKYPDAGVHHGFWDSWKDLSDDVVSAVKKVMSANGATKVLVTGHSLGAAMAADAAIDMKLSYGWDTSVVNFGSPRAGDKNFEAALATEVPSFWRITHHHDLVPHTPAEKFGFYHSMTEVFFPDEDFTSLNHVVCDGSGEDKSCSDQCAAKLACTSVDDHLHYIGFVLGSDNCASAAGIVV